MLPLASSTWNELEIATANQLFKSGRLTMGQEVREFEQEMANLIGTKYGIMFNSGSSANLAMIAAIKYVNGSKLSANDRVIVPAVSWSTTYYPVSQLGYQLDFVDIDLNTLNMNVEDIEKAIRPNTKAIFVVNLLGNPANLSKIKQLATSNNLILLEDNCESLGASIDGSMTGSFGDMSSHSFYFSHHICTMEGGMVNTNSKELMETLVSLRSHGWTRGLSDENSVYPKSQNKWEDLFRFVLPGYNIRPTELSGAIGRVQLKKLPKFVQARQHNAIYFQKLFENSESFLIQKEVGQSSWFGFSIILNGKLSGQRHKIIELLTNHHIETRPIVAGNFTLNPVMKHLNVAPLRNLVNANKVHADGFFIGNHHFDITENLKQVHSLLIDFEK